MRESEWESCKSPGGMFTHLYVNRDNELEGGFQRKNRLWFCACLREVWDALPEKFCFGNDALFLRAVEVTENFADRMVTRQKLEELHDYLDTQYDQYSPRANLHRAAMWASHPNETYPHLFSMFCVNISHHLEQGRMAHLLREVFGNPFRPRNLSATEVWRWRISGGAWTPVSLAEAAYQERLPSGKLDPIRLLVLADSLEEAGCDDEALLMHLRSQCLFGKPFAHFLGCWALDLVLGKS